MKLIKAFVLFYMLFFSAAQGIFASDYKFEVALIYKLSKFVHWPEAVENNLFNNQFGICVLGNADLAKQLLILKKRTIKSYPIYIYNLNYSDEVKTQCQVVFIDPSRKAFIHVIVNHLQNKPTLTLSTLANFAASGGMIEFTTHSKPIGFTINLHKIKESELEINSALLKMATLVSTKLSVINAVHNLPNTF